MLAKYLTLAAMLLGLPVGALAADSESGDWLAAATQSKMKEFDGTQTAARTDDEDDHRGEITIRRIKPQCKSDWDNDPTALPYFFYQLKMRTGGKYPCYVNNEGISLLDDEIYDYPLIYFTSHYGFDFTEAEVENLKKYLARGGTLMLDDCAGSGPFMDSVPPNVQRIIPGAELKLMLRESKEYFDLFNIVYELKHYPKLKEQFTQPFQAAYLNGRPAIVVCPNDYGCSWEVSTPPTALNPLGGAAHGETTPTTQRLREEVYQISINWLFYCLTH